MKQEKKYNVIYADPPWAYNQKQVGRGNKSGAIGKYDLMSNADIGFMPIPEITEKDALCFMWATTPLIETALKVMAQWKFNYKTLIVWEKTGLLGMGNWLRVQTEFILIGVKGKVKPFSHQHKNIYKHPVCEHSAKPHFFRELVMELADKSFEKCERLELFARSRSVCFQITNTKGGMFSEIRLTAQ